MAGSVLAVISDTHIGSSTALATPEFEVHTRYALEAQRTRANLLQNWIYNCWLDFWDYVRQIQGNKRRLVVVHLGDVIDGNHHSSTQLMPEIADQTQMALELLEPVAHRANTFFGIFGTGAHAGQDNAHEALIYKQLSAQAFGHTLTLSIDGHTHHFVHHGRAGGRPWTSSAAGMAAEIALDFAQRGENPPEFIWSGHNHRCDDSGMKVAGTRAISMPAWQLKTSHGWKVAGSTVRSDIGGMIVIDGHILDNSKARYRGQPDERKVIDA